MSTNVHDYENASGLEFNKNRRSEIKQKKKMHRNFKTWKLKNWINKQQRYRYMGIMGSATGKLNNKLLTMKIL